MPRNDETVETGGSHLQGGVDASYAELVALFGEPGEGDGSKVDARWALRFDDPRRTVATVYNYKDGPAYLGDEGTPVARIREWHVGGFAPAAARRVQEALDAARKKDPFPAGCSEAEDAAWQAAADASHVTLAEPGPLVPISALRPQISDYMVYMIWRGEFLQFACTAGDWNHAAEQALNAYPGAVVTGIEV